MRDMPFCQHLLRFSGQVKRSASSTAVTSIDVQLRIQNRLLCLEIEPWHGRVTLGITDSRLQCPHVSTHWMCSWKELLSVNVSTSFDNEVSTKPESLEIHPKTIASYKTGYFIIRDIRLGNVSEKRPVQCDTVTIGQKDSSFHLEGCSELWRFVNHDSRNSNSSDEWNGPYDDHCHLHSGMSRLQSYLANI